jgi:twitching motility protein PilU
MKKGAKHGMRTFDQALFDLFESGQTTIEDTLRNADSLNELKLYIKLNSKRAGNAKDSKPKVELSILGEEKSENEDGTSNFMRKEDPPSESSQSQ